MTVQVPGVQARMAQVCRVQAHRQLHRVQEGQTAYGKDDNSRESEG